MGYDEILYPEEESGPIYLVGDGPAVLLHDILETVVEIFAEEQGQNDWWSIYEQKMADAGVPIPQQYRGDGNGWSEGAVWVPGYGYVGGDPVESGPIVEAEPEPGEPVVFDPGFLEVVQNGGDWLTYLLLNGWPNEVV